MQWTKPKNGRPRFQRWRLETNILFSKLVMQPFLLGGWSHLEKQRQLYPHAWQIREDDSKEALLVLHVIVGPFHMVQGSQKPRLDLELA